MIRKIEQDPIPPPRHRHHGSSPVGGCHHAGSGSCTDGPVSHRGSVRGRHRRGGQLGVGIGLVVPSRDLAYKPRAHPEQRRQVRHGIRNQSGVTSLRTYPQDSRRSTISPAAASGAAEQPRSSRCAPTEGHILSGLRAGGTGAGASTPTNGCIALPAGSLDHPRRSAGGRCHNPERPRLHDHAL
jgi:hypothetical protein